MKRHTVYTYAASALAASSLLLSACLNDTITDEPIVVSDSIPTVVTPPPTRKVFIATSDYKSGLLISLDADSLTRGPDSLQVHQDAKVITHDSTVYVLERYGADNILRYNPKTQQVMYQAHLGANFNPSDLVFQNPSTAYVTLENVPKVLKVNPSNGEVTDSLDISPYTFTPDSGMGSKASSPHAANALLTGDTLLVLLQRRNGSYLFNGGPSVVLVIDTKTFTIKDTLQAPDFNGSDLWINQSGIYVSCIGKYDSVGDGAVYRWDRATGIKTTLFSEAEVGGNISSVNCNVDGLCMAAIYNPADYTSQIRPFDLKTGAISAFLPGLTNTASGVVLDAKTGRIFVGERNAKTSGIVVFGSDQKTTGSTLKTGLPPASMALFAP
jgi:hypothetical protein